MRIDIHPHVISPDTDRYPLAPVDGKRSVWSADAKSLTPEQLIAAMDVAGIDRAAVVHSSTTYGFDNSLVADAAASFHDRLTGVCSIDALAPDAVDTLKGWLDRGCTGLRLFTTGTTNWNQAQWLNDPATWPVWEFASGINLSICLQVRTEGLGMVKALMDRFPAVPVILDHLAHPDLTPGPPYEDAQKAFDLASYEADGRRALIPVRRRDRALTCPPRLVPAVSLDCLLSTGPGSGGRIAAVICGAGGL